MNITYSVCHTQFLIKNMNSSLFHSLKSFGSEKQKNIKYQLDSYRRKIHNILELWMVNKLKY